MPIFSGPSGNPTSLAHALDRIARQDVEIDTLRKALRQLDDLDALRRRVAELEADKAFLMRRAFPKPVEVTL